MVSMTEKVDRAEIQGVLEVVLIAEGTKGRVTAVLSERRRKGATTTTEELASKNHHEGMCVKVVLTTKQSGGRGRKGEEGKANTKQTPSLTPRPFTYLVLWL